MIREWIWKADCAWYASRESNIEYNWNEAAVGGDYNSMRDIGSRGMTGQPIPEDEPDEVSALHS